MIKLVYVEGSDDDVTNVAQFIDSCKAGGPLDMNSMCIYAGMIGTRAARDQMIYFHQEGIDILVITNMVILLERIAIDVTNPDSDQLYIAKVKYYEKGNVISLYNVQEVYPNIRLSQNLMKMYMADLFERDDD
jgi:hypothetical protein